jgi:membrane-associated phospholipid phosphatase
MSTIAVAPAEPIATLSPRAGRVLAAAILTTVAVYLWLFLSGGRFFVFKTAVMPIFLLYALALPARVGFVIDWLPFLTATVLFDATRGAIFALVLHGDLRVFMDYVIVADQALLRVPAAAPVLQQWRTPALDTAAILIHALHFAFFLLFGLVLWHLRRDHFARFRRALVILMALGLLGYLLVPTIPPWLAAEQWQALPPMAHITAQMYNRYVPELYGSFDTNPVAAMPSLHAAFPFLCALIGWQAYGRRVGLVLVTYAAAVMLAVVYLGEHYVVDVLGGIAVALVAERLSRWTPRRPLTLGQSLVVSGAALALTYVLLVLVI